ncbi:AMP-binding protein [Arthrobacter sp. KK5.5]|uniref:AMP-binding protein n=1 Tax=Arthrobacter sp. KK5.5 TaxID=3373084 RepID=UPI003EE779F2
MNIEQAANHSELTPLPFLQRSAEVYPDKPAVIHGSLTWTYRRFAEEVQRTAKALAARIDTGDTVAYLAPNIPELLVAHYAVPLDGGVLLALNTRLSGRELEYILGHAEVCERQDDWDAPAPAERAARLSRQGGGMIQAESARVVDGEMRDVPADGRTMGEIVLRGNNVMIGYFKDPEATARAFAGGWFHTGDLGSCTPTATYRFATGPRTSSSAAGSRRKCTCRTRCRGRQRARSKSTCCARMR